MNQRAIYIGKSSFGDSENWSIDWLSYGQTGMVIGESMEMYNFIPDTKPGPYCGRPLKRGWLVEHGELYFPAA
jgi:hypothetical protein